MLKHPSNRIYWVDYGKYFDESEERAIVLPASIAYILQTPQLLSAARRSGEEGGMPDLPTGTITFLFTDLEGSTRLWDEQAPDKWVYPLVFSPDGTTVAAGGGNQSRIKVWRVAKGQ